MLLPRCRIQGPVLLGLGVRVRDNNVKGVGFAALSQAMYHHAVSQLVTGLLQVCNALTRQHVHICTLTYFGFVRDA